MTLRNFKLTIEYDGSAYNGWQRQNRDPSIQQTIEMVIEKITRQKVRLIGSGRTDAGVHAFGQVANFQCATHLSSVTLHKGLNGLLPRDISIRECVEVSFDFHARYDAKSKLYRYTIYNHPLPIAIGRQYVWWLHSPLDIDAMQSAARLIRGIHDFKAFEGSGSPREHTVRHVTKADIDRSSEGRVIFEIESNGFLRYMVRNITGTLVMVGQKKIAPGTVADILLSRDRKQAGMTAPPQGLCLISISY
jgi:tRNA pseudouridine38-40 synthase